MRLLLTLVFLSISVAAPPANKVAGQPFAQAVEDRSKVNPVAQGAKGPAVVRAQVLLDRARFSPGEIDGVFGEDMQAAIKGFQESNQLPSSGTMDAATWRLINRDLGKLLMTYTVTAADAKYQFEPLPQEIGEKAKRKSLGFETPEEALGERFHCSPKLITDLNPGKKLDQAGERLVVPRVRAVAVRGIATRVVVSKAERTVVAYGASDKKLAQYPATIGSVHDPLPIGKWTVTGIVPNPWFHYDPELFWNPDPKQAKATLPPGPNNPSGAIWIGLSKEHYGIHGTPDPGSIRHTESAGCIRMTNWDAMDLSRMIRRGTPVILQEE